VLSDPLLTFRMEFLNEFALSFKRKALKKKVIIFHGVGKSTLPMHFALEHKISLTTFISVISLTCYVLLRKRIKRKNTINLRVRYRPIEMRWHTRRNQISSFDEKDEFI